MALQVLGPVPDTGAIPFHGTRNTRITSRLYRLVLDPSRFSPYADTAGEWMGVVATEVCARGMKFEFDPGGPRYRRCWYIDTVDGYLRRSGLALRVTDDGSYDKRYRLRLSGVHRDRYIAAMTSVAGRGTADHQFVEEILASHSQFIKSCELRRHKLPRLNCVADVIRLYPGTEQALESRRHEAVTIADGVVASQLVDTIGEGFAGGGPAMTFEMTAAFDGIWRLGRRIDGELEHHMPDSVEFTFRYDSLQSRTGLERFSRQNVVMACSLFQSLGAKRGWIDRSA